jgi:hypothetical protein
MALLSDLVTTGGLKPMGVAATVDGAPSGADDTLDVLYVTETGEQASEQGLRWATRGGALPADGDDALLFLDSLGDPWALVWPSGGSPDVSGSLSALDARLDALEAAIPQARVYGSTHAAIANGASGTFSFDSESFDSGLHSTTVNPSRLIAPVAGLYQVTAGLATSATVVGRAFLRVFKNGTTEMGRGPSMLSGAAETGVSVPLHLAASDYVELQMQNSSGASITPLGGPDLTWLAMARLGSF